MNKLNPPNGLSPYQPNTPWPEDRSKAAIALWGEGYSAGKIAKTLGGGVKRGAVMGFLHRKGLLKTRPKDQKSDGMRKRKRKVAEKPKAPPTPPKLKVKPVSPKPKELIEKVLINEEFSEIRIPMIELKDCHCRWIYLSSGETEFCGHPKVSGSSYCAHHHRIVYVPVTKTKKGDLKKSLNGPERDAGAPGRMQSQFNRSGVLCCDDVACASGPRVFRNL